LQILVVIFYPLFVGAQDEEPLPLSAEDWQQIRNLPPGFQFYQHLLLRLFKKARRFDKPNLGEARKKYVERYRHTCTSANDYFSITATSRQRPLFKVPLISNFYDINNLLTTTAWPHMGQKDILIHLFYFPTWKSIPM